MCAAIEDAAGRFLANIVHIDFILALLNYSAWLFAVIGTKQVFHLLSGIWMPIAPLFKKEGNAGSLALVTKRTSPIRMHWSGAMAAFAATDHPINSFQQVMSDEDISKEWLTGEEANSSWCLQQFWNAFISRFLILD